MSSKHWLAAVASVAVVAALLPATTAAAVPARPLTAPAPAPLSASPDIAQQFIVKFEAGHRGAGLVRAAAAARGLDVAGIRTMGTGALVIRLDERLGERPTTALLGDLRGLSGVRYAVPDRLMTPVSSPTTPSGRDSGTTTSPRVASTCPPPATWPPEVASPWASSTPGSRRTRT